MANNPEGYQYYKYAKDMEITNAFAQFIKEEMKKYKEDPESYKKNRELEKEREALKSPELSAQLDEMLNLNQKGGVKKNVGIIHMSSENENPSTPPRTSQTTQEEDLALLDALRIEKRKRNRDAVAEQRQEASRDSKARRKLDMEAVKGGKRRRRKSRKNKKSRKSKKRTNKSRRRRTNKRRRTRRKR